MATGMSIAGAVTISQWPDIEDRPAAARCSTETDIKLPQRFGDTPWRFETVVVGQLFPGIDRPLGEDEYPSPIIERFAVRVAGVIDKAGVVPANTGIDSGVVVDREKKGMVPGHGIFVVPLDLQRRADPFADILDDPLPFADGGQGKGASPLYT